jgi:hypothetical protein
METKTIETARFLKRTKALSIETTVTETLNYTNNTVPELCSTGCWRCVVWLRDAIISEVPALFTFRTILT